jgi:hypothetical protein
MMSLSRDLEIAKRNGALIDLVYGDAVRDGEGERATFISYGDNAPLYVNLQYGFGVVRIPNAELKRG